MPKILCAILLILTLSGCSLFEKITDQQVIINLGASQAVSQYISAGDIAVRAASVIERLDRIDKFIKGNPLATSDNLLDVVEKSIHWKTLSINDRVFIENMMSLVSQKLRTIEIRTGLQSYALRELLDSARATAERYLID